jgi:hypothetical protein
MYTPTRRDFFTYAVSTTLASALPISAQTKRHMPPLRLVVDLIGPMAFREGSNIVDVWLPNLEDIDHHEAGISTSATGIVLNDKNYTITLPKEYVSPSPPTPYAPNGTKVFQPASIPIAYNAIASYIHLTLPVPNYVVLLNPVQVKIYPTGASTKADCLPYAVGLRFIYDNAGAPTLSPPVDNQGLILFDGAPFETQLNMSIGYAPYHLDDLGDVKATKAFHALALLLGLDLQVEFNCAPKDKTSNAKPIQYGGPWHNCHAPIILLK